MVSFGGVRHHRHDHVAGGGVPARRLRIFDLGRPDGLRDSSNLDRVRRIIIDHFYGQGRLEGEEECSNLRKVTP